MARTTRSIASVYFSVLLNSCTERHFKHTTQLFEFKSMVGGLVSHVLKQFVGQEYNLWTN